MQAASSGDLVGARAKLGGHKRRRSSDGENGEAALVDAETDGVATDGAETGGALPSAAYNTHGVDLVLPEPGGASAPSLAASYSAATARSNDATVPSDSGVATEEAVAAAGQGSSPSGVAGGIDVREVGRGNGRGGAGVAALLTPLLLLLLLAAL